MQSRVYGDWVHLCCQQTGTVDCHMILCKSLRWDRKLTLSSRDGCRRCLNTPPVIVLTLQTISFPTTPIRKIFAQSNSVAFGYQLYAVAIYRLPYCRYKTRAHGKTTFGTRIYMHANLLKGRILRDGRVRASPTANFPCLC